jgi:hypothetical protein
VRYVEEWNEIFDIKDHELQIVHLLHDVRNTQFEDLVIIDLCESGEE